MAWAEACESCEGIMSCGGSLDSGNKMEIYEVSYEGNKENNENL
nr:hypothetical protein [uncultured Acetatifactor sp.]